MLEVIKRSTEALSTKGLTGTFYNAVNAVSTEVETITESALNICYHLNTIKKCKDDLKECGYDTVEKFAEAVWNFKPATVRTYVNIGSKLVKTGKFIHSVYALPAYKLDKDGNFMTDKKGNYIVTGYSDFSPSQLGEIMAITELSDGKITEFSHKSATLKATVNFQHLLENGCINYSCPQAMLRSIKTLLKKLSDFNCELDTLAKCKDFMKLAYALFKKETTIDSIVFNSSIHMLETKSAPAPAPAPAEDGTPAPAPAEDGTPAPAPAEDGTPAPAPAEDGTPAPALLTINFSADSNSSDYMNSILAMYRVFSSSHSKEECEELLDMIAVMPKNIRELENV
jgi:hypothetical protein